jgi:hypothetical protein
MDKSKVILGTLCLALAATVVAQWIALHRMGTPIIAAKPRIPPATELSMLVEERPSSPGAAIAPRDSSSDAAQDASAVVAPDSATGPTPAESAFRTAMIDYQQIALRQQYAPLVARLRLSPEQAEAFIRILAEHWGTVVARRVPSDYTEQNWAGGNDEDLREVLTQAQIDAFHHYQRTTDTRQQVESLRNELMASAEPLRDAQIAPLVDALYDAEMRLVAEVREHDESAGSAAETDEERRAREDFFLDREAAAIERKLAAASAILSRAQLQGLKRQLEAQRSLSIAGAKVIRLDRERQLQ